jgi:putative membrane protein
MEESCTKRDYLAQDRTHLANERTLLAYWRTALAFLVLGAFLIKFFPSIPLLIIAVISIMFAIIMLVYSMIRYSKCKCKINKR